MKNDGRKHEMKTIAEFAGKPLQWLQPRALKMEYELRSGEEIVGTLRFRSSLGTFATGQSGEGGWTFKRVGFWQTRATVRANGADTDLAVFKHNTWSGGGTLELASGRKYRVTSNAWQTRLEFLDEANAKMFALQIGGLVRLSATITVPPAATLMPELPWMLMFGCYLTVMMQADTAGLAVVCAASAG
jgi:hypothetical protein